MKLLTATMSGFHTRAWLYVLILSALPIAEIRGQAVIVDYNKTAGYTTADASFNNINTTYWNSVSTFGRAYSETTQLSPVSGYTGPVFYGGYQMTASTPDKIGASLQLVGSGGQILLQDYSALSATTTASLAVAYVFKQANWSNYTSGNVSLTGMTVNCLNYIDNAISNGGLNGRWIVEQGSTYYISQATFQGNLGANLSISDFTTTNWAVYDPTLSLNFDQSGASYSTVALNNVTGVGVYFENDAFNGTGVNGVQYNVMINSFSASAVPEPSVISIMLVAAVGYLPLMRRLQRRS